MRRVASLALLLVVAACGGDSPADAASLATTRDSAGVRIVENVGETASPGRAPVMAAEPELSIGEMDGPPEYQLYQVRAATRLSDGSVALFDGGSQEVRYYDATGRFIRRAGGKGGGPGEYQGVGWMVRLPGDSLMLNDVQARRITVLAPDGTVARSVALATVAPPPGMAPAGGSQTVRIGGLGMYDVVGPMWDGSLLARARGEMGAPEPGAAVTRDSATYVRLEPDGTLRDTIGVMPGDERQLSTNANGGRRMMMVSTPPFGRMSYVAMDADGFWSGSGDSYQIEHRTAGGQVDRMVRRALAPIPVTPAVVAAAKGKALDREFTGPAEMKEMMRQMMESNWENTEMPATMPAHGGLQTDPSGRLWVAEITEPSDEVPRWTAFDAEGRMLGTIAMPEGFRALEFGADYVIGVATDENEVERVELFMFEQPAT